MNETKTCHRCKEEMKFQKKGKYYKCQNDTCGHVNKPTAVFAVGAKDNPVRIVRGW
jgi:anaerobic ribonucleoside-triphosphate reductase